MIDHKHDIIWVNGGSNFAIDFRGDNFERPSPVFHATKHGGVSFAIPRECRKVLEEENEKSSFKLHRRLHLFNKFTPNLYLLCPNGVIWWQFNHPVSDDFNLFDF